MTWRGIQEESEGSWRQRGSHLLFHSILSQKEFPEDVPTVNTRGFIFKGIFWKFEGIFQSHRERRDLPLLHPVWPS
jgi:hypothetical protein